MLAVKIVRFSEERGRGRSACASGGDCTCMLEHNNVHATSRLHYLLLHAQEKRRRTLNRKPPFMHFKRLNSEYVKKQRLLARMYFSYFAALNTQSSH